MKHTQESAYREGYRDGWAYRAARPKEGTAADPVRETEAYAGSTVARAEDSELARLRRVEEAARRVVNACGRIVAVIEAEKYHRDLGGSLASLRSALEG